MWGWLPGCFDLARAVDGSGPAGGLPLRKAGRLTVSRGLVLAGGVGCLVFGVGDTPAAGGLLRPLVVVVWLVVGALACVGVACCRGSGVVRPGCLACVLLPCVGGGVWVWVGWL